MASEHLSFQGSLRASVSSSVKWGCCHLPLGNIRVLETEPKGPAGYLTCERQTVNKCDSSCNPGVISPVGQQFGNHFPKGNTVKSFPVRPRKLALKEQEHDKEPTSTRWPEPQTRSKPPACKVLGWPKSSFECFWNVLQRLLCPPPNSVHRGGLYSLSFGCQLPTRQKWIQSHSPPAAPPQIISLHRLTKYSLSKFHPPESCLLFPHFPLAWPVYKPFPLVHQKSIWNWLNLTQALNIT